MSNKNFEHEVYDKKLPAMVAFTADWCKPSRLQREALTEVIKQFDKEIYFEILNVDECEELTKKYQIKTLPTILLFALGQEAERLVGFQSQEYLTEYAQALLKEAEEGQESDSEGNN